MTEEQKKIILIGSRYEMMNKHIDLSNHDGVIREGIAKAMQEYAEFYYIAQTKKISDKDIIEDKLNRLAKLEADIAPLNRLLEAVTIDNGFIMKLRNTYSNAEWRRKIFSKLREIKKNENI